MVIIYDQNICSRNKAVGVQTDFSVHMGFNEKLFRSSRLSFARMSNLRCYNGRRGGIQEN